LLRHKNKRKKNICVYPYAGTRTGTCRVPIRSAAYRMRACMDTPTRRTDTRAVPLALRLRRLALLALVSTASASTCRLNLQQITKHTTTFHAANASHLYLGCAPPADARIDSQHPFLPDFINIGAQKGGTTTLAYQLQQLSVSSYPRVCFARHEVHFFDNHRFMTSPITGVDLQEYARTLQGSIPKGCLHATEDRGLSLLGEKSPAYEYVSYTALRICQAMPSTRLFFLLRNPVSRAYSAFHHTTKAVRWMFDNITFDPDGFARLVDVETAIVQGCQSSIVPSGDPRLDVIQSAQFRECCSSVTRQRFGLPSWRGCQYDTNDQWSTMYGHIRWARVRMGIYVWQVRIYLRYHSTRNVLFGLSEDFFADNDAVIRELLTWVVSSKVDEIPPNTSVPCTKAVKLNSQSTGQMLNATAEKLCRFYSPYNVELEQVLGRPTNWPLCV